MQKVYGSHFDAAEDLNYWQERLRLEDWDIEIILKSSTDLAADAGAVSAGYCQCYPEFRRATIGIACGEDSLFYRFADMEVILVHEMLHLSNRLYSPPPGSIEYEEHEAHLTRTAQALISLRRGK